MKLIENLGYEQLKALKLLSETPDIEGTALCSKADCSWHEMFSLAESGLIDAGAGRIEPQQMHPQLTKLGREAVEQIAATGLFQAPD
jgi:hypothetical protein